MNLTQKYRAKNGEAKFEVFAERDNFLYGRVLAKEGYWLQWTWCKDGVNLHGPCFDIEEIPATPKWHGYVADGYNVLCKYWDDDENNSSIGFINYINNNQECRFTAVCDWKNAEPIPTQCGKYCTAVKDGKTMLLPLE